MVPSKRRIRVANKKYFTRNTFRFMSELADNNDREWFAENKHRYEADIKDASLGFIEDFAAHLEKLSPHFMAGPRSLFRIYRDVRFAKDKSPYKTHTGIHFRHEQSKSAHAPGYYLHLEPGSAMRSRWTFDHTPKPTLRTTSQVSGRRRASTRPTQASATTSR